jgi:hypothetical protein
MKKRKYKCKNCGKTIIKHTGLCCECYDKKLRKKVLPITLLLILIIPMVNAELINSKVDLNIHCSNSTFLNISYIKYTSDSTYLLNESTSTIDLGNDDYLYSIDSSINNRTGEIEYLYVCDLNGESKGFGNTINITLNNSKWIWITLLVISFLFLFGSFIVDEEILVYLSGIFFLINGMYVMINGMDLLTISELEVKAVSYSFIGLGLLFTIGAYIFNGFYKGKKDEEDEEY